MGWPALGRVLPQSVRSVRFHAGSIKPDAASVNPLPTMRPSGGCERCRGQGSSETRASLEPYQAFLPSPLTPRTGPAYIICARASRRSVNGMDLPAIGRRSDRRQAWTECKNLKQFDNFIKIL